MKTLIVFGATGNQGGAVLRYFAKQQPKTYHLRGITRNPSSSSSQELQALGVEMVQADASDIDSLKLALNGATHIFATTDSNQMIFDFLSHSEKVPTNHTALTYAQEIEEGYGRNIIEAAAATPTLERIIWSSLPSPKKWSRGKYDKVKMFDAKENIADMFWAHSTLKEKLSVLMVGFFLRNALNLPAVWAPHKQSDGVYELAIPMSGDVVVPVADVDGDVGSWIEALFAAPPGVTMVGSSEFMTWKQWLQTWCSVHKVEGRYRKSTSEEFRATVKGEALYGQALYQEIQVVEERGFSMGMPNILSPENLREQGISIQTTPIAEAMRKIDWSSIL